MKFYNVPTDCYHCHESLKLYHPNNEGLTCTSKSTELFFPLFLTSLFPFLLACHYICHKQCQATVNVTCEQAVEAKTQTHTFFRATDENERRKWVITLQRMRNTVKS